MFAAAWCCAPSIAHPPVATTAVCTAQAAAGDSGARLSIILHHDALAFILNDSSKAISDTAMNALLDDPRDDELRRLINDASDRLQTTTVVKVGERRVPVTVVNYPSVAAIREWSSTHTPRLPIKLDAELSVELPFDATRFSIAFTDILGPVVLTYDNKNAEAESRLLTPGDAPREFELPPRYVDTVPTMVGVAPPPQLSPDGGTVSELTIVLGLIAVGVLSASIALVISRRKPSGTRPTD